MATNILSNVCRPAEFRCHKPHKLLTERMKTSPDGPVHERANQFFKKQIIDLLDYLPGRKARETLVFGPNRFDDFPLSNFLVGGWVYGIDLDLLSMTKAKNSMPPKLRERLVPLQLDASLFANQMIRTAQQVVNGHNTPSVAFLKKLMSEFAVIEKERQLPFQDKSFDLIVSVSTVSQFVNTAFNAVLKLQWDKFGEDSVWRFYSEKIRHNDAEIYRGQLLDKAVVKLRRRLINAHIGEMARLVRPDGVIFLSDHALKVKAVNDRGRFSIGPEQFEVSDRYVSDLKLRTTKAKLLVEVGSKAVDVETTGQGNLTTIAKEIPGLKLLEQYHVWNVNFPGAAMFGVPGEYFLDTALVMRPTATAAR